MNRTYGIEALPAGGATVVLPPELAGRTGGVPAATLAFGAAQAPADVDGGGEPGRIGIAPDLLQALRIPADGRYQVRVRRRHLRLGPVVGILAARRPAGLTPDTLNAMANHLLTQRGGLFFACDRESLDVAGGVVNGHRLLPGAEERWEAGRFPLPQVLFRRYGVPVGADDRGRLQALGVQVFNERAFHKWEAWQWLADDRRVRPHLPETALLQGPETVLALLERFPTVYVKPTWGSLGARILRVRGRTLEIPGGESIACDDPAALTAALAQRLPRPGIAQQGIDLASVGDRLVDFRVVVQKDGYGDWAVTGIVGRCGSPALFLSNMATGGFPLPVEQALALLFGDSPVAIFRRKEELCALALAAARALDGSGLLLGDLGLDIAYDRQDHPWLIEANNRDPDHNIGWEADSWPLFYRFRTRPLEFARHLAGFGGDGDD